MKYLLLLILAALLIRKVLRALSTPERDFDDTDWTEDTYTVALARRLVA